MAGYRIPDLIPATGAKGSMLLEVADLTEPNASNQSKYLTVDQLKNYIILAVPQAPTGVKWITKPTATLSADFLTINVSSGSADWDGVTVNYSAASFPTTLPAEGLIRQDGIAALQDGTFVYKKGDEGESTVTPNLPTDSLWVAYFIFTASEGQVQEPAVYYWGDMEKSGTDPQTIEEMVDQKLTGLSGGSPEGMYLKTDPVVTINQTTNEITVLANTLVKDNVEYPVPQAKYGPFSLPALGFFRTGYIAAYWNSTYGASFQLTGPTGDQKQPMRPPYSPGGVWVRDILLTNTGVIEGNLNYMTFDDARAEFIAKTEKGTANGVATLDAEGKVPAEQLPEGSAAFTPTVAEQYQPGQPAFATLDEVVAYVLTNLNTYQ